MPSGAASCPGADSKRVPRLREIIGTERKSEGRCAIVLQPLQKSTLADWFETPKGRYVLDWEQAQYESAVEDVFGFNALQVGLPEIDFLRANRMPHRLHAGRAVACDVRAEPSQLPFASQSVDLVLLPHVLEFSAQPHEILRESERVLMPEGHIVISGFNPMSLWGLKRKIGRRRPQYPWCGDFIGLLRLRDWLKLLGFELNGGKFGCYAPPFDHAKWLKRFAFLEQAGDRWWPIAGGLYVIRAKKRTIGMRLVTPAWRSGRAKVRALAPVARRESVRGSTVRRERPALKLIECEAMGPAVSRGTPRERDAPDD
jgi:SAM-dependent methyltransferase